MSSEQRLNHEGSRSWQGRELPIRILVLLGAGLAAVARGQAVIEFPVPTAQSRPVDITSGEDGNLWFTEYGANKIGWITPAGVIVEFPIPTAGSGPVSIAAGPDGNLWFVKYSANKIGRITTSGVITDFPIPTASSIPGGIAAGPDGNLWFTEQVANKIGRITTAGVITEFLIPTASQPRDIAAGPDDNVWFTEPGANQIGRITTGPTVPQPMAVDAHTVTGTSSSAQTLPSSSCGSANLSGCSIATDARAAITSARGDLMSSGLCSDSRGGGKPWQS